MIINQTSKNHTSEITTSMFKNYFKTAFRNLRKNKLYAVINIFGLTVDWLHAC